MLCTATNYRLLLYRPAGKDGQQQPSLVTSSEQVLDLTTQSANYADIDVTKAGLRPLILKLAGMLVAQMQAIDDAKDANPGLHLDAPDPVSGRPFVC